jgi:hypothetical protein
MPKPTDKDRPDYSARPNRTPLLTKIMAGGAALLVFSIAAKLSFSWENPLPLPTKNEQSLATQLGLRIQDFVRHFILTSDETIVSYRGCKIEVIDPREVLDKAKVDRKDISQTNIKKLMSSIRQIRGPLEKDLQKIGLPLSKKQVDDLARDLLLNNPQVQFYDRKNIILLIGSATQKSEIEAVRFLLGADDFPEAYKGIDLRKSNIHLQGFCKEDFNLYAYFHELFHTFQKWYIVLPEGIKDSRIETVVRRQMMEASADVGAFFFMSDLGRTRILPEIPKVRWAKFEFAGPFYSQHELRMNPAGKDFYPEASYGNAGPYRAAQELGSQIQAQDWKRVEQTLFSIFKKYLARCEKNREDGKDFQPSVMRSIDVDKQAADFVEEYLQAFQKGVVLKGAKHYNFLSAALTYAHTDVDETVAMMCYVGGGGTIEGAKKHMAEKFPGMIFTEKQEKHLLRIAHEAHCVMKGKPPRYQSALQEQQNRALKKETYKPDKKGKRILEPNRPKKVKKQPGLKGRYPPRGCSK